MSTTTKQATSPSLELETSRRAVHDLGRADGRRPGHGSAHAALDVRGVAPADRRARRGPLSPRRRRRRPRDVVHARRTRRQTGRSSGPTAAGMSSGRCTATARWPATSPRPPACPCSCSTTGGRRSTRTPPRSRTPSPPTAGCSPTRASPRSTSPPRRLGGRRAVHVDGARPARRRRSAARRGDAALALYDMEATGDSVTTNAEADALVQREILLAMAGMFLGDASPRDPLANPLHADPAGLPPMLIQVGGAETLLDDSTRFGRVRKRRASTARSRCTRTCSTCSSSSPAGRRGRRRERRDGGLGASQARALISPARAGAGVTPRAGSVREDTQQAANDQRSSVRRAERRTASSIMRPASSTKTPPSARAAASSRRWAAARSSAVGVQLVVDDGDLLGGGSPARRRSRRGGAGARSRRTR